MKTEQTATGGPIRPLNYTDWKGRPLNAQRMSELNKLQKCRHCGEPTNNRSADPEPKPGQQTVEEVRALLGPATFVLTYGGYIPVDCWLEHHRWGLRYIRMERRNMPSGPCLVEGPYPDEPRSQMTQVFGIFPLVFSEYAL